MRLVSKGLKKVSFFRIYLKDFFLLRTALALHLCHRCSSTKQFSTTRTGKSSRNNSITVISDHMEQKTCSPTTEVPGMWSTLDITCDRALTICFEKYQNYNYKKEFEVARIFCSCYQGFNWRLPSFHCLKDDIICSLLKRDRETNLMLIFNFFANNKIRLGSYTEFVRLLWFL